MANKEVLITDKKEMILALDAEIEDCYLKISEAATTFPEENIDLSVAAGIIKEIIELDKELTEERERLDGILAAMERADEIDAIRKSLNSKIKSIEKDNMSNYETIGRAAFEAYKDNQLQHENYDKIFSDVVKMIKKIDETESAIAMLVESDNKKLFDRVKNSSRSMYLKKICSSYYKQLQRYYKNAGESICNSELILNLEADSVQHAIKPFKENLEGLEKIEEETSKLTDEDEKLKGNLEGLGVQSSPVRTINTIEKHINQLYEQRKYKQHEAGYILSSNRKDPLCKKSEIKVFLKEIDGKLKEVDTINTEIQNLKDDIEVEKQLVNIESMSKKIEFYNEKIQKYNIEIEELQKKILLSEDVIQKLKKVEDVEDSK
ncbi:MAG: hypothetical protein PQJ46_06390 [Spirochaetales bacterium]|nr:hypothetical protein [Spirochaetales bacterium]